jgi:hypothetical protein
MHSGKAPSREKYPGGLQRVPHENTKGSHEPKPSHALQRWLQELPKQGYWNHISISRPWYNLPTRIVTKTTETVNSTTGQENTAFHPTPPQPTVDPDNSTESESRTNSDKKPIEPDELRLLARKVYTALGSVVDRGDE